MATSHRPMLVFALDLAAGLAAGLLLLAMLPLLPIWYLWARRQPSGATFLRDKSW